MSDVDRLAEEALDERDEQILAGLRQMWSTVDPVPDGLSDRIRFAMSVASLEAEVARIVELSASAAGVRTTYERATSVTFETASVTAMLDIDEVSPDRVDLTGWISVSRAEVELRERHRSRYTHTDDNGRFVFSNIERGLVHIVLRLSHEPGARAIITPAIEL